MDETKSRSTSAKRWLLVIPLIIVLALVVNGLNPAAQYATLFFPSVDHNSLVSEKRRLDLMGSVEKRAQVVAAELLLGPVSRNSLPLFSADSRLLSVLKRGDTVFIDIHLQDPSSENAGWKLIYQAFAKSLSDSVPGAGKVRMFIDGNELVPPK